MTRTWRREGQGGFSLLELLLTLGLLAMALSVVLNLLVGDLRQVGRLGRWLRERQVGQRTLELLRDELQRAEAVSLDAAIPAGCGTVNRRMVLQLRGRTMGGRLTTVSYTYGAAPSAIWRGAVLLRCGPAYGIDGSWSDGEPLPRVLIDALPADGGFSVASGSAGLLRLTLVRQLADGEILRQEQVAIGGP